MSFLNLQGGYGLMGAANSGLVSCNGYERWRMHWKHPQSVDYISARNAANTQSVASDITQEDGNQTFLLRDFVTYGDVVRIKLPYKDTITSSNQYIWLENHQVGSNNKLDFLQYSNTDSCRPQGAAGIYAYYQVGRDVLEGNPSQVWDSYDRDNLKIIPAEGYYDYELLPCQHNVECISTDEHEYAVRRGIENPLCGGQDQEFPLFPEETDTVLYISREFETWRKYMDTIQDDHLPQIGDNLDAFCTHTKINMGTNPSSNNAKTFHSKNTKVQSFYEYVKGYYAEKNVQTTYLTGLSIEMIPIQGTGNFLVNIRWDDYEITNDTRWTGKIALKDTAILTAGKTITLAQNRTVAQPTRDPETGLFAGRTNWRCESGSYFRQDSASVLHLTENSSLVLESGSRYELSKDATLRIGAGCKVTVNPGARVQFKGIVEIDSGGTLKLYDTTRMGNLSRLIVRPGGKLIVNGGTLTSACPDEMWQGIEVVGDRTKRQLSQYQGTVELRNGAVIENALCGIRTGLREDTLVFATTGGIIKANNATFRNNAQAVVINSYAGIAPSGTVADNACAFDSCTFTVNTYNLFAANNTAFSEHVRLWDVKAVKFYSCVFNSQTNGRGIYAEDAGFTVSKRCPDNIYWPDCVCPESVSKCDTFSGFSTAVEVNTTGDPYPVTIDQSRFLNNVTGVHVIGNNFASVTRCDFDLQNAPTTSNYRYGLYLDGCSGYTVEENHFHRSSLSHNNYMGVRVHNSGTAANTIYRNEFDKMNYGIYVTGTNSGLQMLCNDFNNNDKDIYVADNHTSVSLLQGSLQTSAGNTFDGAVTYNIQNASSQNIYYFYTGKPFPDNPYYPNLTTSNVLPLVSNAANPCASTLCGSGGFDPGTPFPTTLAGFQSGMEAYATALANPLPADGGNVDQTLAGMQQSLSESYYAAVRTIMADTALDLNALEQWHAAAQPIADPYSLTETRFAMGYDEPFGMPESIGVETPYYDVSTMTTGNINAELANYAEFHAMKLALRAGDGIVDGSAGANDYSPLQQDGHINWYALTPAQIAQLQTIAERNTGRASVMARGVLCFFFGICYDDDLSVDDNYDNMDNNGETRSAKSAQPSDGAFLNVYPNPADDVLYVELSGAGIRSVALYDLMGRVVETVYTSSPQGIATLDLHNVPAGVYVLRVTGTNGKEYNRKVVVD